MSDRDGRNAHVRILLARLDVLRSSKDARSRAASERLERRGVTAPVLEEVRKLLSPEAVVAAGAERNEPTEQEARAAEEAMWGYYNEWSTIARSAVSDRRMLRRLGLVTNKRSREEEDEAVTVPPTQPAPGQK